MVFSTPIFLFCFLPIALLSYYLSPQNAKNISLLVISLLFYAWGEVFYLLVMISSILLNFFIANFISKYDSDLLFRKIYLSIGVAANLSLLISFKYTNFIFVNINRVLSYANIPIIDLNPIHLPLGISFFTFQAISYIVDVYRKEAPAQKNLLDFAMYISLFPQLIAGPIVRYRDILAQIKSRIHSLELFENGIQRFVYGLSKKMLIANPVGEISDSIFFLTKNDLTLPIAWIGAIAYSLQIYFDFSGYSDMAIGLGRMFGFRLLENFNYPYISKSLREFWKRWHISLSSWFRDYVYIPLGGSRVPTKRIYVNLLIVFILTGFWHGASWNFLFWGLFHGIFITIEHFGFSKILKKAWLPLQHSYLLLIVIIGWVFFRADSFPKAINYLISMVDINSFQTSTFQFAQVFNNESIYAFSLGIVLSTPIFPTIKKHFCHFAVKGSLSTPIIFDTARLFLIMFLLSYSILKVASSTYNPFIYFRF